MSQWFKDGLMYRGCSTASGWATPGCQVVPGSCPGGTVSLAYGSTYDACAALTTVAGCSCLTGAWSTASGGTVVGGTCVPPDSDHPGGSWCKVNTTSCPSSLRAHKDPGADWDYCGVATTSGCVCANAWRDATGVTVLLPVLLQYCIVLCCAVLPCACDMLCCAFLFGLTCAAVLPLLRA